MIIKAIRLSLVVKHIFLKKINILRKYIILKINSVNYNQIANASPAINGNNQSVANVYQKLG